MQNEGIITKGKQVDLSSSQWAETRCKCIKDFAAANELKKVEELPKKNKIIKAFLLVFFGSAVGAVNGFFGAGGGMLAVPLLIFAGGLAGKKAHATAIAVMLPLCLASVISYGSALDFKVLIPVVIGVTAGGILGAKLLKILPEDVLFFGFNLIMLIAGLKMLY